MFRTLRSTAIELSHELEGLPQGHLCYALDAAILVIGPSGLFVLVEDDGDLLAAASAAAERAAMLRMWLSDRLAWVPFVDAIVVTTGVGARSMHECVAVPVSMIRDLLINGPAIIDASTLMQLALLDLPRVTM